MEFIKISWEKLYKDCVLLSKNIKGKQIDEIVAISRGGVVMGRLLSDFLSLPMSNISIISYIGTSQIKEPIIVSELTKDIKNKIILLIDDVADTGKTFKKASSYLKTLGAKNVITVSPYIKPHAVFIPDFWVGSTDKWIVFPYEVWEVQDEIANKLQSKEKAKKLLKTLGAKEWELHE